MFKKGECANPRGRPKGSTSRATMRGISERVEEMVALQKQFLNAVAVGDVPPFSTVEECLGAIEFLSEGIAAGNFEPEAARAHIDCLRAFIEAHAARNFVSFASGRVL
jgi:hypothetical protein